eukprot:4086850-Prymnesium_polylepis.1
MAALPQCSGCTKSVVTTVDTHTERGACCCCCSTGQLTIERPVDHLSHTRRSARLGDVSRARRGCRGGGGDASGAWRTACGVWRAAKTAWAPHVFCQARSRSLQPPSAREAWPMLVHAPVGIRG